MKKWTKLTECKEPFLTRGALLKFPAGHSFESEVVMLICEGPEKSSDRCLIAITGHKAGINCYQILPPESSQPGCFVSVTWLIENWNKWIWPDGRVEDVLFREALSAAEL